MPEHLPHRAGSAGRACRRATRLLASRRAAVHPSVAAWPAALPWAPPLRLLTMRHPVASVAAAAAAHLRHAPTVHLGVAAATRARGSPQSHRVGGGRGEVGWPAPCCPTWSSRTSVPPSLPEP
uniref:Uncharacterized protein n=1 Tax=Arundo donax TaxID=35708 RepID=A0A0A9H292_ARUDO